MRTHTWSHVLSGPSRKPAAETSESTPRDIGIAPEENAAKGLKHYIAGARVIYSICKLLIIPECGVPLLGHAAVGEEWSSHP